MSEPSGRLTGKVAVVTGGASGIGRATCERFSAEGASILVADVLDERGAETVDAVTGAGGTASFVHLDASSLDDNRAMAEAAVERYGGIDVLVTAAGISHGQYVSGDREAYARMLGEQAEGLMAEGPAVTRLDLDGWQKVLDVNLTGTLLAVHACVPHMLGRPGASIVTIASIAAKVPEAGPLAYAVSKSGVWMLTKSLARDLAPHGVRINAIGPGFIETPMTEIFKLIPGAEEQLLTQIPMGRIGQPTEIASTALFLASDDASYFAGELLHPDGGFYTG